MNNQAEITDQAAANTDREIWRERPGDYYADSIHVTAQGGIGIDCGGHVIVRPVRDWHASAKRIAALEQQVEQLRAALRDIKIIAPLAGIEKGYAIYSRAEAALAAQPSKDGGQK